MYVVTMNFWMVFTVGYISGFVTLAFIFLCAIARKDERTPLAEPLKLEKFTDEDREFAHWAHVSLED